MKRIIFFSLILSIISLVLFCTVGYALEKTAARIIHLKKDVKINAIKADVGNAVKEGDEIVTGKRSYVEIGFDTSLKNNIRIAANSLVTIKKISSRQIDITLSSGKIFSLLTDIDKDENFRIITPVAVAGVRGTGWSSMVSGDEARFSAFENNIFVQAVDNNNNLTKGIIISEGYKLDIRKFELPERINKVSRREKREWDKFEKILNANIKSFVKRQADQERETEETEFGRESERIEKIRDRAESTVERSDAGRIENNIDRGRGEAPGGQLEKR